MVTNEATNRPDNTAFTQQRLPAWQPMLSAGIIIPGFVLIGLAFIGIGVALFITSRSIQVLELDYTGVEQNSPCFRCSDPDVRDCVCTLEFSINTLFEGPVFFYYGLSNYFQNYRRYGVSRDDNQLYGDLDSFKSPIDECEPYKYNGNNQPIVPCGSIANSMFNDTFRLFQIVNGQQRPVPLDGKGIAWWTDYNIKFRNPSVTPLRNAFNGTVKPPFWSRPAYELDTSDPTNNGFINQDFLVWMRRAALPDFQKLYRRITEGDYAEGLPAGTYSLEISYNYPVLSFNGRKKVVFSNVSWMGGKNEFLGIAYLVIGSLCVVMSVVMLIVYAKFKFPEED
ncbi:cell cycle control protein 50B [Dunckerocampus dactyliophorus]|uniref:cell cycle control protein 50B n=1 Tax=Dunckerocampus dactyliophorus TaxID=161453 RepID=UPI002405E0B5|nr:cell cycle control protein 50B [Dunckerocampus dactyliophorus]XP_054652087.1 cell cycle control protein 50B [Dunckerocampus dactyliophorus]XP_054652088.1 cell cycle control protein 50B [Dunckerocampus dactyliophorus]XP_054652090.1 cell cycle control protein 50B [Dunckerocampus dactyliophorus]XP_054652091.1 cell cycle control protein 50B [Dunckerocampus dactyliophorus]XP_054652092.1 cell cycle control protein 50B [Dunckerocampus dactyliophorus]